MKNLSVVCADAHTAFECMPLQNQAQHADKTSILLNDRMEISFIHSLWFSMKSAFPDLKLTLFFNFYSVFHLQFDALYVRRM